MVHIIQTLSPTHYLISSPLSTHCTRTSAIRRTITRDMSSPDRHRKNDGGSSSTGGSSSKDNGSGMCSSCMQANGDGDKSAFGGGAGGGFSNNNNNNNNNNGYSSGSSGGGGGGEGVGSGGVPPIHVTAKVLFGSVSAISALNAERKKKA